MPPIAKGPARRGKASSLTEQVYARLRADILSCAIEPGQAVSEAELAVRFEVSKTPVREALATLRTEGFVRTFPRRGYQVVPLTIGRLHEILDVRMMLEIGGAELACARVTPAEIAELRRMADVEHRGHQHARLGAFIAGNRRFHLAIAAAARNDRLNQLLGAQLDELERFFYLGARLQNLGDETQQEHHRIADAIEARDTAAARLAVIRHSEATRKGLVRLLTHHDSPVSV